MSVLNRYFLMFASMYACVMAYFVLNGYSFGPKPIPITKTIDGALLIPGPSSDIALRGAVLVEPVLEPKNVLRQSGKGHEEAAAAEPEPESESEPEVEKEEMDSGVTDVVGDVVKCRTTHGDLIMDVRPSWAPVGSARFTELVEAGHFTQLPFYRVCPKYLTQFGHRYYDSDSYDPSDLEFLKDDPSLRGVRDMDFGYLFFTGNEANGRKSEMAISFCEMDNCDVTGLGHKPWEVPVASIRHGFFETLLSIMDTGKPYPKLEVGSMNGKGPDLEKLQNDKSYLKDTFPEMAYFEWCRIVQKSTNVVRPTEIDHPDSKQKRNTESTSVKEVQGTQVSQTKVAAKKEDDDGEEKSLEEYLLGGESRKKRLEGIDAMGLAITSKPIQIETPKPKVAVLPSGLAGATSFKVRFDLCEGSGDPIGTIVVEVHPDWAPLGAKRFQDLVAAQFFDKGRFFRSIKGFVSQFGIPAIPLAKTFPWARLPIPDDPVATTNARGTLSFASAGKNSRSHQLFFNSHGNSYLDKEGFSPIGLIIEGEELLDRIYTGYGDKPNQGKGMKQGNEYFAAEFPELTYMESVRLV